MNTRSIKIAFPGSSAPEEFESDATTWGALKGQIYDVLGKDFDNQKVRDRKTKHEYSDDNAVLPNEDLQLLVSTEKNKSGGNINKGNYHKAAYSPLRTFCKKMTGFAPNGKQLCLDALDKYYGKTSPKVEISSKKKSSTKKVNTTIPATPKKDSLEVRVSKLEKAVFSKEKNPNDDTYWG